MQLNLRWMKWHTKREILKNDSISISTEALNSMSSTPKSDYNQVKLNPIHLFPLSNIQKWSFEFAVVMVRIGLNQLVILRRHCVQRLCVFRIERFVRTDIVIALLLQQSTKTLRYDTFSINSNRSDKSKMANWLNGKMEIIFACSICFVGIIVNIATHSNGKFGRECLKLGFLRNRDNS